MSAAEKIFARLAGAPGSKAEAQNGLRHVASLTMTKLGDGLMDPKLVLAWLAGAIGVPSAFVSAFVPLREAGALLPQLWLASRLEQMRARRIMWAVGSAGQGIAALGLALCAWRLSGMAAGIAFVICLALFAVSRAAASVSYKDVLGKTVREARRGAVTGLAGSIASVGVLAFALMLALGGLPGQGALIAALFLAAALWGAAALTFMTLDESPSTPGPKRAPLAALLHVKKDARLRAFIIARGCLVATALAPPFIVLIAGRGAGALGQLGALVVASSAAAFLSSYVWGRLADRSARLVLVAAGLIGALAMVVAVLLGRAGLTWALPGALFVLMIAHNGVRLGRSTYLVDMAPEAHRAAYAASANTLIGGLLLLAGALGGALSFVSSEAALMGFAVLALIGAWRAFALPEARAD